VEPRVRAERSEMLRILSSRKRHQFQGMFLGSTVEVLFEDKATDGCWSGLTGEYLRVNIESTNDLANRLLQVKITSTEGDVCTGKIIDTEFGNGPMFHSSPKEVSLCA
jgi:threonylcarbamoyladenosine tRNA methylthiotransferase MtaB